jgi:16S rRNA (cytosine1402-N4)-methyltransferase
LSEDVPHKRRPRYAGKNPRRFEEKYKERDPERYPETVARVLASGKTPAGSHVPIMVTEILRHLAIRPGETAVDCTLGYGGHTREMLPRLLPGGRLVALDVDQIELPKTTARLQALGFGTDVLSIRRSNFAGLPAVLASEGLAGCDALLADLGVSSMQLDTPERGFSTKIEGPLDMRMNPAKGLPASEWIARTSVAHLRDALEENADEPRAAGLATALAGKRFETTTALAAAIRQAAGILEEEEQKKTIRRVFQAIRIAVNEEFSALDTLLRVLPFCLNPGGRAAILTFHSGEDRRVKKAFQAGHREGIYSGIATEVVRASPEECRANPRATSAKLRWAVRAEKSPADV